MINKLSAVEAFNQLQANCDFVEKTVKKELSIKGRSNLLIFNFVALLSILNENSLNDSSLTGFVDILKSKIGENFQINLEETEHYIGNKLDIYSPLIVKYSNGDEIAHILISEFYFEEAEIEFTFRLGLSLSYLTNMIVMIADMIY